MILILQPIAGILYFALQLEYRFKIPSPFELISLSFIFHSAPLFKSNPADFVVLALFLLFALLDCRLAGIESTTTFIKRGLIGLEGSTQ